MVSGFLHTANGSLHTLSPVDMSTASTVFAPTHSKLYMRECEGPEA